MEDVKTDYEQTDYEQAMVKVNAAYQLFVAHQRAEKWVARFIWGAWLVAVGYVLFMWAFDMEFTDRVNDNLLIIVLILALSRAFVFQWTTDTGHKLINAAWHASAEWANDSEDDDDEIDDLAAEVAILRRDLHRLRDRTDHADMVKQAQEASDAREQQARKAAADAEFDAGVLKRMDEKRTEPPQTMQNPGYKKPERGNKPGGTRT